MTDKKNPEGLGPNQKKPTGQPAGEQPTAAGQQTGNRQPAEGKPQQAAPQTKDATAAGNQAKGSRPQDAADKTAAAKASAAKPDAAKEPVKEKPAANVPTAKDSGQQAADGPKPAPQKSSPTKPAKSKPAKSKAAQEGSKQPAAEPRPKPTDPVNSSAPAQAAKDGKLRAGEPIGEQPKPGTGQRPGVVKYPSGPSREGSALSHLADKVKNGRLLAGQGFGRRPQAGPLADKSGTGARANPAAAARPATPTRVDGKGPGDYPEVHPVRRHSGNQTPQTIVFLHGGNVGNWSWDPQVLALGDFHILTLHLPAFGARSEEPWQGLESAADDVAALIADEVAEGGVHLVGMSLGGVIALHVAARHPELVESLMITGTPVAGVPAPARALSRMQLKLLGNEWYWRFQAGAHGMVDDERDLFASHGLALKPANLRAIMDELDPGGLPANLAAFTGPVLILAGAKEPKVVQRSFAPLQTLLPQAVTRLVPNLHHQWNIEDPVFFNSVVRRWVTEGKVHTRLVDPAAAKPAQGK